MVYMETTTTTTTVRLHRVRAGYYETTTGDPVEGTIAVMAYHPDDSPSETRWYAARWEHPEWAPEGHVELVSTGDCWWTLRQARADLPSLMAREQ